MADSHGESTSAHTEADGGHGGTFPPFESSTFASQLVSLVIAFVALYLIVSRIALPRVGAVIDARQNRIEGDLAEAQKLKDESEAALKAYESDLASAHARNGEKQWARHRRGRRQRHRATAHRRYSRRQYGRQRRRRQLEGIVRCSHRKPGLRSPS